jgi:hypothetical protein
MCQPPKIPTCTCTSSSNCSNSILTSAVRKACHDKIQWNSQHWDCWFAWHLFPPSLCLAKTDWLTEVIDLNHLKSKFQWADFNLKVKLFKNSWNFSFLDCHGMSNLWSSWIYTSPMCFKHIPTSVLGSLKLSFLADVVLSRANRHENLSDMMKIETSMSWIHFNKLNTMDDLQITSACPVDAVLGGLTEASVLMFAVYHAPYAARTTITRRSTWEWGRKQIHLNQNVTTMSPLTMNACA